VSRNGSKKVIQTGSKKWSKRGQILTPETDVQKLGSRNDIRGRLQTQNTSEEHLRKRFIIKTFQEQVLYLVLGCLGVESLAWWVCGNLLVDFGERNCSVAKIVDRNPDDSGQVTVNQRTTTPLFKVIIRNS